MMFIKVMHLVIYRVIRKKTWTRKTIGKMSYNRANISPTRL